MPFNVMQEPGVDGTSVHTVPPFQVHNDDQDDGLVPELFQLAVITPTSLRPGYHFASVFQTCGQLAQYIRPAMRC